MSINNMNISQEESNILIKFFLNQISSTIGWKYPMKELFTKEELTIFRNLLTRFTLDEIEFNINDFDEIVMYE